ncbi:MAG: hypothetical protein U0326_37500 [Polyangiales bacterium]
MRLPRHAALIALLAACERSAPSPPEAPPRPPIALRPPSTAPRPDDPGPVTEQPTSPETPLPDEIARCVARARERLPPEVASAIEVMGIPSLLEDGCRLDVAPRTRNPALCEAISSSALRESCGVRAAISASSPERCPSIPGLLGRDPVCVAVAAHNPSLCAAAPGSERVRCLALAHADARRCARVEQPFRDACTRDVTALAQWLSPRRGDAANDCDVTLDLVDPGADASTVRAWRLLAHRRGAWLDDGGSLWLLDPASGWPRPTAPSGDEPLVALRVQALGMTPGVEVSAEARIILPDALALDTKDHTARATVSFATIPSARGDRYALTAHIEGARAGLGRTLTLRAEGFVRDVAPSTALRPW